MHREDIYQRKNETETSRRVDVIVVSAEAPQKAETETAK